jgi:hypothetical protein
MKAASAALFAVLLIGPLAAATLSDDAYAAASDDYGYKWTSDKHYLTINQSTLTISVPDAFVVEMMSASYMQGSLSRVASNFPSWASVRAGGASGVQYKVEIVISPGMAYDGELWAIYKCAGDYKIKLVVPLRITGSDPNWGGDGPVDPDDPNGNNGGSGGAKPPSPPPNPPKIPSVWDDIADALSEPGSLMIIAASSLFFAFFVRSRVRGW